MKGAVIRGEISLNGSKSLSNRLLIMQAIAQQNIEIKGISNAKDTRLLQAILNNIEAPILDAGDAGTAYRFLTALLALRGDNQLLVGSERMCERPVGILVEALNDLGANIEYKGKKGYPPLYMKAADKAIEGGRLDLQAHVSSQYISALLMIAPLLPKGLELHLKGKIISRPYIQMTINLMRHFGIAVDWTGNCIRVVAQDYQMSDFVVEADWSAASYYYALAAFSTNTALQLNGLYANSLQGDTVLVELFKSFGVATSFNEKGIFLQKNSAAPTHFNYDFSNCPDIAQTLAVLAAGLNIPMVLSGLETLNIKETNRIEALYTELTKLGAEVEMRDSQLILHRGIVDFQQQQSIATYKDHRMAMAFAPLKLKMPNLSIENPAVVEKSYLHFWKDLEDLGLYF